MLTVYIEKNVYKDLDKIPSYLLDKFYKRVEMLGSDLWPSGSKKLLGSADKYRLRMSDYRILYMIDQKNKRIVITMVRHRKDVYQGLS